MDEYKKTVRKRLIDLEKDTTWLAAEVNARTNMHTDAPYISRVLSGKRNSVRVRTAINEILGIEASV